MTTEMPPRPRKTAATTASTAPVVVVNDKSMNSLLTGVERAPINSLKPHPRNPRVGNIEAIAESLETNGQFKPAVIQKSSGYIIAGNHTWKAAKTLGWTHLDVVQVDVNDKKARKIMLADNKTSDAGTYDDEILAELLTGMDSDLRGSGYSTEEVDQLLAAVEQDLKAPNGADGGSFLPDSSGSGGQDFLSDVEAMGEGAVEPRIPSKREEYASTRDEESNEAATARGAHNPDLGKQEEIDRFRVKAELQAEFEIRERETYLGDGFWQVPELRVDMLLEDVPDDFMGWGGPEVLEKGKKWEDNGERWYMYNYSLGSTKKMPFDRTVLAFNTFDEKFENWWDMPAYYTARLVSAGIKMAVVPDFSFYDHTPRNVHLNNVYRAQWMGRFFQECGIKVIPRIQFNDEHSLEFCMLGIPIGAPLVTCSMQNFKPGAAQLEAGKTEKENERILPMLLDVCLSKLKPKKVLIYGNTKRLTRVLEEHPLNFKGRIQLVSSYSDVRRASGVFGRQDGVAALTSNDRKKLREEAQEKAGVPAKAVDPDRGMTEDDLAERDEQNDE